MSLKIGSQMYKFHCARCASEYFGTTVHTPGTRVDEQAEVTHRTGARLTQPSQSAICDHRDICATPLF